MLLVWSRSALASQEVHHEIDVAGDQRRCIIPVRLDSTAFEGNSAYLLSGTHWIDASHGPINLYAKTLIEAIDKALAETHSVPEADRDENREDREKSEFAITHVYRISAAGSDLLHVLRDCPTLQGARSPSRKYPLEEGGDFCAELIATKLRPCFACLKLLRTYREGPGNLISTVTWNNAALRIQADRLTYEQNTVTEIPWHFIEAIEGTTKDWLHPNRLKIVAKDGRAIELKIGQDPLFHAVGAVLAGLAGFRW